MTEEKSFYIGAGDANHYGLVIIVLNIVEIGESHAELTIKDASTPIEKIDIEISSC